MRLLISLLTTLAAALSVGIASAGALPPSGQLRMETAYFDDQTVSFLQPAVTSSDPSQGQFAWVVGGD